MPKPTPISATGLRSCATVARRYKVVWSRSAARDLEVDYVAADSGVDRALALYVRIRDGRRDLEAILVDRALRQ